MNKMAIGNGSGPLDNGMNSVEDERAAAASYCKDYIRGHCARDSCRYTHELPPKCLLKEMFRFCHDFQNKGCYRNNCKFIHSSLADEDKFYCTGKFPRDVRSFPGVCQAYLRQACGSQDCKYFHPPDLATNDVLPDMNVPPPKFSRPPPHIRDDDSPPEPKFRRYTYEDSIIEFNGLPPLPPCANCDSLNHKVKLLHDNISVLLKKVADLTEKNQQLTSMNEFLLEQTTSIRSEQSCVITSRHGTSAPVSLATVSMTPVVSLASLPTLVPANGATNLTLAPAASRAQIIPTPQILTVSTTQQLMGNSGTLIVTSAGAQQLMQVSDSGNLMGGGQTVVAVTPAQLTLAPQGQQLMSSGPQTTVVQQQLVQPQLTAQHQHAAPQFTQQQHLAAQQSAQHLAAQQSAQHLAVQQSQHLADLQSAQHLAAAQSAQHLAAAQSQHLAAAQSAQQLVHQTSTQQITISSTSQPMALPNSQAQTITFPIISQSILPH